MDKKGNDTIRYTLQPTHVLGRNKFSNKTMENQNYHVAWHGMALTKKKQKTKINVPETHTIPMDNALDTDENLDYRPGDVVEAISDILRTLKCT